MIGLLHAGEGALVNRLDELGLGLGHIRVLMKHLISCEEVLLGGILAQHDWLAVDADRLSGRVVDRLSMHRACMIHRLVELALVLARVVVKTVN